MTPCSKLARDNVHTMGAIHLFYAGVESVRYDLYKNAYTLRSVMNKQIVLTGSLETKRQSLNPLHAPWRQNRLYLHAHTVAVL